MLSEGSVRIATSRRRDAEAAAQDVLAALRSDSLAGIIVFAGDRRGLQAIAAATQGLQSPVIGCTTVGEITPWGAQDGAITAIGFPTSDFAMRCLHFDGLQDFDPFAAHRAVTEMIAECAAAERHLGDRIDRAGLLLIDGLSCREELITHTMRHLFGDIPTVGGSAADGFRFGETHLLHERQVRSDRAVVALLSSRHAMRVIRSQCHDAGENLAVVTRVDTAERRIIELNGISAAREYARVIGATAPLSVGDFAAHPLMVRVAGTY